MSDALQQLLDKEAIREQLYNYCRAVDRLDIPLGRACFHEDSFADYNEGVYKGDGPGSIDWICDSHAGLTSYSHQISNILIGLHGANKAGSEAYMTGTMRLKKDGKEFQIMVRARYLDAWEKREGRWAIARREVAYDHDEIREVTSLRGPANSAHDASDASYRFLKGTA